MGQYDEDINRIIRDFDLERIETQTQFWDAYFRAFSKRADVGFGKKILSRLIDRKPLRERIIFQAERPSERVLEIFKDLIVQTIQIRGRSRTVYRNKKTGRFVKYAGSR